MANRNGKGSLARKANQKRRSTMNKIKKIEKQLKNRKEEKASGDFKKEIRIS